jgi:hypothetical protein
LQYKRDTRVSRQNQATLHISSCLLALSYAWPHIKDCHMHDA